MSQTRIPRGEWRPLSELRLPDGVSDLLSRRLRKVHERVAEATERHAPDAAAEIAIHYDQSGCGDKAYEYALLAADRAISVYANQDAIEFLRIAERNTTSPAQLAEVRVRLARVAEAMARYEEAGELCEAARLYFSAQGDSRRVLTLARTQERLNALLGQPARRTLERCLALDEQAQQVGADDERSSLFAMMSQAHLRLGERDAAERAGSEAVRLAERAGDPSLLADAYNRLAIAIETDRPTQAGELYERALEMYRSAGDVRGQARCHNNRGILFQIKGEFSLARAELDSALELGRSAGMRDIWGLAALNLGVMHLRSADYDRATELFGEALAMFANLKSTERQLYALYNMAHLERERGEQATAAELYEVAVALAEKIGQSDVEIGGTAGLGLALLDTGKLAPARAAERWAADRLRSRTDWFQGREMVEALAIRILAADGLLAEAVKRFHAALALADVTDVYGAAWLTAQCADVLKEHDPVVMQASLHRYAARAEGLGYTAVSKRYGELLAQR